MTEAVKDQTSPTKDKEPVVKEPVNTDPNLGFVLAKIKGGGKVEAYRNFSGGKGTVNGVDIPAGGYLVKITSAMPAPDPQHPDVLSPEQQASVLNLLHDRFVEAGDSEARKLDNILPIVEPYVAYVGVAQKVFDALFELDVPTPTAEPKNTGTKVEPKK